MTNHPVGYLRAEDQEEYEDTERKKKLWRSSTPENVAWRGMKTRCFNKNRKDYPRYGGRGITVCDRWLNSFDNFLKDMGERPTEKHSLDRIDTNGNYCKENCRWATISEQNNNRRDNMVYKGETAAQASKRLGGGTSLVNGRIVTKGWSFEKAFTSPIKRLKRKNI